MVVRPMTYQQSSRPGGDPRHLVNGRSPAVSHQTARAPGSVRRAARPRWDLAIRAVLPPPSPSKPARARALPSALAPYPAR